MKKLLSIVLCTIMLCSVTIFPTSAEDNVMTIEEYERAYFGEHYITDAEAASFAMAGYPGVANPEYVNSKAHDPYTLYYDIGSISNTLLNKYFPKGNYAITPYNDGLESAIIFNWSLNYPGEQQGLDANMMVTKILYVLTQLNMEKYGGSYDIGEIKVIPQRTAFGGEPSWHADVNGDGKINAKDILTIKRFIVGIDYRIAFHNDPNNDKAINAKDILQIKRYIVGVDDYPGYVYRPNPDNPEERFWNPIKGYFAIPGM